ncbi:MAG: transaldolase [Actinomycetota bacterium]
MTKLQELFEEGGQSPWLDNLRRDWIEDGQLANLIERGVRGITSNPTIFAKAISGSDRYDHQFSSAIVSKSPSEAYWDLVVADIEAAMELLLPVYEHSGGHDGYVSLEVAPALAHDAEATVAAARQLRERISGPNLMVKVPGTKAGLVALRSLVGAGLSINVTLLFSIERYDQVVEAYLTGLEDALAAGMKDLSTVAGVASFFVSRVDSEIDGRLTANGSDDALNARGKAAVAQAHVVYDHFRHLFSGPRWEALASHGAQVQRPLWASTSTKNPSYPDLLYVDNLIGPHTVNTLPDATLEAFDDHGRVALTIANDVAGATAILDGLSALGVDLDAVANKLEDEGLRSFEQSFDDLLIELEAKAAQLK